MARGRASQVGDTRTSPNGYHYTRTEAGWQLTGRLVAAEKLGRDLKDNERIRYVNGDRTDLSPTNIEVYETRERSKAARRARIMARIEELQAELDSLDEED